jgi:hypothetical protein
MYMYEYSDDGREYLTNQDVKDVSIGMGGGGILYTGFWGMTG